MKEKEHQKVVFVYTLSHLPFFQASIIPTNPKSKDMDILNIIAQSLFCSILHPTIYLVQNIFWSTL